MPGIIVISIYLVMELKVLSEFQLGELLIFLLVVLFVYLASKFSAIH